MRTNSGYIGNKTTISTSRANGIHDLITQQINYANWPASGTDFIISPEVSGVSNWVFIVHGDLIITTPGEYTITPQRNFTSNVKMWGAGGARGFLYTGTWLSGGDAADGGGGGFANGRISFVNQQPYLIRVGEGGARSNTITTSIGATYLPGGLNVSTSFGGTQGAGYTAIFSNATVTQANTMLMAGGGGAGGHTGSTGGAGGGSTAGSAAPTQGGGGGTQAAGGSGSTYNNATAGTALKGGLAANALGNANLGGGGGGYFGGGGGNIGGGGGGSGRVSSDSSITNGYTVAGSGSTPGFSTDPDRGTAGNGGSSSQGSKGANGKFVLKST